jgi:hypothetical protein
MEERIMRTLGKIAATLGVIGAIAVGSAVPAAAWYGYYHRSYYHHHYGYYHPYRHYGYYHHRHLYGYYPYHRRFWGY